MYCAPVTAFATSRTPAPGGAAGPLYTARLIRQLVTDWRTRPEVIQAATSLIYTQPEKDDYSEAARLFEYVQGSVRYVRDIVGLETLATPGATLRRQSGDCDDQVTLLASLLESVGYPTRLVIEAYQAPGAWEHIYLEALLGDEWVAMDPTEHQPLGWRPPGALSRWIEPR